MPATRPSQLSLSLLAGLLFVPASQATPPAATGTEVTLSSVGTGYKLFIPSTFNPSQSIDLLVHFHGDPATVYANAKYANLNALVVTANLGALSSAYQTPFQNAALFQTLLDRSLDAARAQPQVPDNATWHSVAVSSFSAGYAAVREVLKQPAYVNRIDSLLLADSLYASYTSTTDLTPLDSQMAGFRAFADAAADGNKTFIFAHSLVPTSGYCDTETCADDLAAAQGIGFSPYVMTGLGGLHYYRRAQSGNLTLFGATESDGPGHSLFLQNMGQWLDDLPLAHVPEPSAALLASATVVLTVARRRHVITLSAG